MGDDMYKEKDIVYETKDFWVLEVKYGYDVYKKGITHSIRCAQIGWANTDKGLGRAIKECNRRQENKDNPCKNRIR
jgi:hypothetical protein